MFSFGRSLWGFRSILFLGLAALFIFLSHFILSAQTSRPEITEFSLSLSGHLLLYVNIYAHSWFFVPLFLFYYQFYALKMSTVYIRQRFVRLLSWYAFVLRNSLGLVLAYVGTVYFSVFICFVFGSKSVLTAEGLTLYFSALGSSLAGFMFVALLFVLLRELYSSAWGFLLILLANFYDFVASKWGLPLLLLPYYLPQYGLVPGRFWMNLLYWLAAGLVLFALSLYLLGGRDIYRMKGQHNETL